MDMRLTEVLMEVEYVPKLKKYMTEKDASECHLGISNVFEWVTIVHRDLEAKGHFDYPRPSEDLEKVFELEEEGARDAIYLGHYKALLKYVKKQKVFVPGRILSEVKDWKKAVILASTIRKLLMELGYKDFPEFADFYPNSKVLC